MNHEWNLGKNTKEYKWVWGMVQLFVEFQNLKISNPTSPPPQKPWKKNHIRQMCWIWFWKKTSFFANPGLVSIWLYFNRINIMFISTNTKNIRNVETTCQNAIMKHDLHEGWDTWDQPWVCWGWTPCLPSSYSAPWSSSPAASHCSQHNNSVKIIQTSRAREILLFH